MSERTSNLDRTPPQYWSMSLRSSEINGNLTISTVMNVVRAVMKEQFEMTDTDATIRGIAAAIVVGIPYVLWRRHMRKECREEWLEDIGKNENDAPQWAEEKTKDLKALSFMPVIPITAAIASDIAARIWGTPGGLLGGLSTAYILSKYKTDGLILFDKKRYEEWAEEEGIKVPTHTRLDYLRSTVLEAIEGVTGTDNPQQKGRSILSRLNPGNIITTIARGIHEEPTTTKEAKKNKKKKRKLKKKTKKRQRRK